MIYKHQYFSLNNDKGIVSDENNKELRITGNAFRILVFLCEKLNANITEIGDYLDWAKNYDENHIRQYRYKINTVVGYDVIQYSNSIYSLIGDVEKCEKIENNDRITDSLQDDSIELEKNNQNKAMNKIEKIQFNKTPAIIVSVLLLLTFFSLPYGYYNFLRIAVTGVAIFYAYYLHQQNLIEKMNFWFWGLIIVAILFNPLFPIYFDKATWGVFDILTAVFFISFIYNKKLNSINK